MYTIKNEFLNIFLSGHRVVSYPKSSDAKELILFSRELIFMQKCPSILQQGNNNSLDMNGCVGR